MPSRQPLDASGVDRDAQCLFDGLCAVLCAGQWVGLGAGRGREAEPHDQQGTSGIHHGFLLTTAGAPRITGR